METLVCNCLIPFCLIQEEEKERDTEAQTARESHLWCAQMRLSDTGLNIPDDSVGRSDQAHPPLFFFVFFFPFYIATDGIRVRGGLLLSPCSSLLCSLWSRCPQSIRHRTGDCLHKQNLNPGRSLSLSHRHCMKICTPLFRHGKGQPSTIPFAFFNSQRTSKDDTGKNATELPRTSPWFHFFFFFFFHCGFLCPLHKE